ncbi:hypothetical protein V6N13_071840 [Hibiscus sabdariffa]
MGLEQLSPVLGAGLGLGEGPMATGGAGLVKGLLVVARVWELGGSGGGEMGFQLGSITGGYGFSEWGVVVTVGSG